MWCQLTRLTNDCVARSNGGDHRRQQQLHRIVPRRDDACDAHWFGDHMRRTRLEGQRGGDSIGLHPRAEVGERVVDFAGDVAEFGSPRLEARLAKIGCQRVEQFLFPLLHEVAQPLERCAAPRLRSGGASGKRCPCSGDLGSNFRERCEGVFHAEMLRHCSSAISSALPLR